MKLLAWVKALGFTALGLSILAAAIEMGDIPHTLTALDQVGWTGALGLSLWRILPVTLCALALWAVIPARSGASAAAAMASRLARDGVSALLPILPAGGEVVSTRVLTLWGVGTIPALASTVADVTLETASQALFSVLGFVMLVMTLPSFEGREWAGLAILPPVGLTVGLCLLQHPKVASWLARMAIKLARQRLDTEDVTSAIAAVYAAKGRVAISTLLHFGGWLIGVGEAWLALTWMGHPLPVTNVIAMEAVVFALKGVAFMIPWSMGVQEGGYMALGVALGIPPEVALGLSLAKRLPDLALGVPGLLMWQWAERMHRRTQSDTAVQQPMDQPIEA